MLVLISCLFKLEPPAQTKPVFIIVWPNILIKELTNFKPQWREVGKFEISLFPVTWSSRRASAREMRDGLIFNNNLLYWITGEQTMGNNVNYKLSYK